jgi:hypothetical protein
MGLCTTTLSYERTRLANSARTELNHRICDTALDLMGPYAALWQDSKHVVDDGHWHYEHMFTLGLIIGGGTSRIQKNAIAERALGLPK